MGRGERMITLDTLYYLFFIIHVIFFIMEMSCFAIVNYAPLRSFCDRKFNTQYSDIYHTLIYVGCFGVISMYMLMRMIKL